MKTKRPAKKETVERGFWDPNPYYTVECGRPGWHRTPPLPKDPNDKEGIRLWKLLMETRLDSGPDHPDAEARENRLSYLLEVKTTKTRFDDLLKTKPRDATVMREMLDLIRGKPQWEEYMLRRWDDKNPQGRQPGAPQPRDKKQAGKLRLNKQQARLLAYEDYQIIENYNRQLYPDKFKGYSKFAAQWAREVIFERYKEYLSIKREGDLVEEFALHKDQLRAQRRRVRKNAPRS
jgi:hypothetical protein